jgi:hypothetical protein
MTNKNCDAQQSLAQRTRELLRKDARSTAEQAADFGVPYHWLKHFKNAGGEEGANVNRVQHVYEQITGKKLKL